MAASLTKAKDLMERLTGYHFRNDQRLLEAVDTTGMRIPQSNQRLALLRDAVLKHVILDDWYAGGTPKGTSVHQSIEYIKPLIYVTHVLAHRHRQFPHLQHR